MSGVRGTAVKQRATQIFSYGVAGMAATSAHYTLMAFLYGKGLAPVAASTAGAVFGALVAYLANRKWTFAVRHSRARLLRFLAVAAMGILFNGLLFQAFQNWLISSIIVAQLLTTLLVFVATFYLNLKWSFT